MGMAYRIGLDFDNTLVSYDHLLEQEAVRRGWLTAAAGRSAARIKTFVADPRFRQGSPGSGAGGKRAIRDAIRRLPDGEHRWQRLQAVVYGARMNEAMLIDGVKDFCDQCRARGAAVFIVSHKTERAVGEAATNLRAAALAWMERQGFFHSEGLGLLRGHVYFEATRREKIQRIRMLRCTHFVDDLEETFLEPLFPDGVERILYDPHRQAAETPRIRAAATWAHIARHVFDGDR